MRSIRVAHCIIVFGLVGCGAPQGPHIHYARATPEQLAAVEDEPVVWYEFRQGDEVPMLFAFLGMGEMGSEDLQMTVTRPFWVVVFEDGRSLFSFDGSSLIQNPFSRWGLIIGRGENRGSTALLMYVGPRDEAPEELSR
ncbi:MAG: hypothetical protein AAGF12_36130 [Myxococcota bacterium]